MNNQKVFLATTALETFWDTTKPMVFLGEWCQSHHKKFHRNVLNAVVIDSVTQQHHQSTEAYNYTIRVYNQLLPQLSDWLNKIHSTQYSSRYWKIIIGSFLLWYIQVVYDRYLYLKSASELYPAFETIGLSASSFKTPINTMEFYLFATESDAWNLQLFTQILKHQFKTPSLHKDFDWHDEMQERKNKFGSSMNFSKLTKLKLSFLRYLLNLRRKKSVGVYFCGLSNKNIYRLLLSSKFKIFPLIKMDNGEGIVFRENKPNNKLRAEITRLHSEDDFTALVLETLQINMPLNFIEYYKEESLQSDKSFPYSPSVIVGAGWNPDDQLKFWGAKHAEKGHVIVDLQHGGGYGTHQYSSREYLERDNCNAFISWGWKNGEDVIPAPSVLACEKKYSQKKNQSQHLILWVANETPRYILSIEQSLQSLEKSYSDLQYRFASALNQDIRSQIMMRVRPSSKHHATIRELLPDLKIHLPQGKDTFFDQLSSAKLFISDNLQTTFLYSLAFNVPTIVFCDNALRQINAEAKQYFDQLRDCGIYHDSPDSAAKWVNQVAHNPMAWWKKPDVQLAREEFCHQFVRITANWRNEWKNILLNLRSTID